MGARPSGARLTRSSYDEEGQTLRIGRSSRSPAGRCDTECLTLFVVHGDPEESTDRQSDVAHWTGVSAGTIHPMFATIGDPDGTRTVTSLIALLVALGLALAMVAIWLHRATRPDPGLLAPLEVMGGRKWRRLDPVGQRRRLDELRPDGAEPLAPSAAPPVLDESFDAGPASPGFDDLHGADDTALGPLRTAGGTSTPPPMVDTPQQIDRPAFDEFDGGEIDPELLAAASAALDAELAPPSPTSVVVTDDEPAGGS